MTQAQSKAQIHTVFTTVLEELRRQCDEMAAAALDGSELRPWQVPADDGNLPWSGDVTDIPGIADAFKRAEIEENYAEVIGDVKNLGTSGDVISLKVQSDYVAMVERALRARHASPVRCAAHAAARRSGHGHVIGIFSDGSGVLKFATEIKNTGRQPSQ